MGKEELEWLSKNSKEVEKHSGEWIALKADKGIIASGKSLKEIMEISKKKNIKEPTVFKVPRRDEEEFILIVIE